MSKFRVRSKWAPYVDSTAKEKKKNDLSLSKGPLSIFDTCLVCSAALTWSLPQKQVLLGGKVRLALAEQHGKAHILFQGAALALLDQAGLFFRLKQRAVIRSDSAEQFPHKCSGPGSWAAQCRRVWYMVCLKEWKTDEKSGSSARSTNVKERIPQFSFCSTMPKIILTYLRNQQKYVYLLLLCQSYG